MTPQPQTCSDCSPYIGRNKTLLCCRHAASKQLYEAAKKALTCASLNSDVRALLVAAIKAYEGK